MNTISLSEEEIITIKAFLEEVTAIPIASGVYIIFYIDDNTKTNRGEVFVILDSSLDYNSKLTGVEKIRDTTNEHLQIKNILQKYQTQERLSFISENYCNYSLTLMHHREIIAEMSLANGTILFDRFGKIEANKKEASELLAQYTNILSIENIGELTNNLKLTRK